MTYPVSQTAPSSSLYPPSVLASSQTQRPPDPTSSGSQAPQLVAVNPPGARPAPISTRVLELNQRVDAALTLPATGQPLAPRLPAPLAGSLSAADRVWRGVPAGSVLGDGVAAQQIGDFMRSQGMARGLPANWSPEQRDRYASLIVLSGLRLQKGEVTPEQLREDLKGIVALVNRANVRLPDIGASTLNGAVDTSPLASSASGADAGVSPRRVTQELNESILRGDIADKLRSPDFATSRNAYQDAYKLISQLPAADQPVVAANLDRQYIAYIGQREATAKQPAQRELFVQVSGKLQGASPAAAEALRAKGNDLLAARRDRDAVGVAESMLRFDTNREPRLPNVKLQLSGQTVTIDRNSVGQSVAETQGRLDAAQTSWNAATANNPSIGIVNTAPRTIDSISDPGITSQSSRPSLVGRSGATQPALGGGEAGRPPTLVSRAQRAAGELSLPLGMNMNPVLRKIVSDLDSGKITMPPYDATADQGKMASRVSAVLQQGGVPASDAVALAAGVDAIGKAMNVNPTQLAVKLMSETSAARQQVSAYGPQSPLLVDGQRDPSSLERGSSYFSNLLGQGVPVPARTVTIDGQQVSVPAKLKLTSGDSDIDGPLAESYGMKVLDIEVTNRDKSKTYLAVPVEQGLSGTPSRVTGITLGSNRQSIDVELQATSTNQAGSRKVNVPITPVQARVLVGSTVESIKYVEGLSARLFPPASVNFLQGLSATNARGGEYPGGVIAPNWVLNTFGSVGKVPFDNSSALVTSWGRSQPTGTRLQTPFAPGLLGIPNVPVYSGGSAITGYGATGQYGADMQPRPGRGRVAEPFGLAPEQAAAMKTVGAALPQLVSGWADQFGLSEGAKQAWLGSLFTEPDIPSVLIPGKVISEFASRNRTTHPGQEFHDMQQAIETRLQDLVKQNKMEGFIELHHTPPKGDDEVAYAAPGMSGQFTTEWQFAVKGQKALAVLDALANDLRANYGVDLIGLLAQMKGDDGKNLTFGNIREMSLQKTLDLFETKVGPLVRSLGIDPGKVIVPVDTYSDKGGSDRSLVRSAGSLYGPSNLVGVQVDTAGGKPMQGRDPAFQLGTDASGKLQLVRPSVDPTGPNGAYAPTVYVTRAPELGEMLQRAFANQQPLSAEEFAGRRR